ncbi:MAG: tetratricopeptide repeat protein [Planctomycetota bacterium]
MERNNSRLKTICENHEKQIVLVLCMFLIFSTAAVYMQTARFDFVDFDDPTYVGNNPKIPGGLTLDGVKWAFTTMHGSNWFPLVWLSLMIDRQLFGMGAGGFHLTNVVLHIANALLLFWVLKRYTKTLIPSFFVAAFFALHPLHVESVAWVAERKDVLCTLFWMLTMLAYLRFVERRTAGRYTIMLMCFSLGLMSKPMLVTLPFVLLIMDYWPLRRLWPEEGIGVSFFRLIIEKIPLFILLAISSWLTFIAQKTGGSVVRLSVFPIDYRVGNALISYLDYISKMFYPVRLAAFYPYRTTGLADWSVATSTAVLLVVTVVIVLLRRRKYLLAGWLWYLGTLVPVIGLVQVGRQATADRYTYIPLTGLFIMLVWLAGGIISKCRYKAAIVSIGGTALICILWILTFMQVGYWRDTITLLAHTAAVTTDNYLAHSVLGAHYVEKGDIKDATREVEKVMKMNVRDIDVLYNVAKVLAKLGRTTEAIEYYNRILAVSPGDPDTYIALAMMEADRGNFENAINLYREGLKYHPENGALYGRLGSLFLQMGLVDEAVVELEKAMELRADSGIYGNLGLAVSLKGEIERAIEYYKKAIWIDPANAEAHYNLGNTYLAQERPAEAAGEYEKAIEAKPDYSKAYGNLGIALSWMDRNDEAINNFRYAAELDPNNIEAHFNLATALADKGLNDQAIAEYEKVLKMDPDNPIVQQALKKAKEALNAGIN